MKPTATRMKPEGPSACSAPPDNDPRWEQWGPYMSNREWATVRETDGPEGTNWTKFPYEKAAETAYRYCEDGIFGVCDQDCRVCHSYAFWNYRDDHLKERFFGVTNDQGAHGEDVKEMFYYKAADPQYRYIAAEYIYPQTQYPYRDLVKIESEIKARDSIASEGELSDVPSLADISNWHQDKRHFEMEFEMTKLAPDQLYFQLGVTNCSSETARIVAMPMLFLRNTWSAGRQTEDLGVEKVIKASSDHLIVCLKDADGNEMHIGYHYDTEAGTPEILLTHNVSRDSPGPLHEQHFKDSFNRYIVNGDGGELMANMGAKATKAGICYRLSLAPKQQVKLRGFLFLQRSSEPVDVNWRGLTSNMEMVRLQNLVDTYQSLPTRLLPVEQDVLHTAYTNLLWNRQFYPLDRMPHLWHLPGQLPTQLMTVPDKWEQPYLATWDTALHCLCLNCFDRRQALKELMLLLSLIRPDGSVYNDEYRPDGVTPPLMVLAAIDVYRKCTPEEQTDLGPHIYSSIKRHLHWWLHRVDARGVPLIDGGICGVDYVSLFPRDLLETGEGLIWAIFFTMRFLELSLAIYETLECAIAPTIAHDLPVTVGYLTRLCAAFEQNVAQENGLYHPSWLDTVAVAATSGAPIKTAASAAFTANFNNCDSETNSCDDRGSWRHRNSTVSNSSTTSMDGSYVSNSGVPNVSCFDVAMDACDGISTERQRCRWLHAYCYLPLICCCSLPNVSLPQEMQEPAGPAGTLEEVFILALNGTMDLGAKAPYAYTDKGHTRLFVSLLNSKQLAQLLEQVLSEFQFLSQYGIRTMSLLHTCDDAVARVVAPASDRQAVSGDQQCLSRTLVQRFCSGPSGSSAYGGNTNWCGAVNLPYNYLLLEALHKWSTVLDRKLDRLEYPSYTGRYKRLQDIVQDLASRNVALFLPDAFGVIPSTGDDGKRGMLLYETFDGDTGRGYGASHKGGWSAIIARILMLMHDIE